MPIIYNPEPFVLRHKKTGKIYRITETCEFISYMEDKFEVEVPPKAKLFNY
jgi:hypothetical protein